MTFLQGPVGAGHSAMNITQSAIPAGAELTGIAIAHGNWVFSLGAIYTQNGQTGASYLGNSIQQFDTFQLNAGEYVTGFSGTYGQVINTLVIYTNQRCSQQYGSQPGLTLPASSA
jgi:hypothetical protein